MSPDSTILLPVVRDVLDCEKFCNLRLEVFPEDGRYVLQDAFRDVRLVHRVDVHVRDAVCVQVDNLVARVDDTGLLHGFGIASELVDKGLESLRHE